MLAVLSSRQRAFEVPLTCHPTTSPAQPADTTIWSGFTTARMNWQKPRIGTDSSNSGESSGDEDCSDLEKAVSTKRKRPHMSLTSSNSPPSSRSKNIMPCGYVMSRLIPMIKALNKAVEQLPQNYKPSDVQSAYETLCSYKHFQSPTVQASFTKVCASWGGVAWDNSRHD